MQVTTKTEPGAAENTEVPADDLLKRLSETKTEIKQEPGSSKSRLMFLSF